MDTNYQPFGEEWQKEMMRHTKLQLIALINNPAFGSEKMKKKELVLNYRLICLVDCFNRDYPVGSVVKWRLDTTIPYSPKIVRKEAFIQNGQPLVLFEGMGWACSIEPIFIQD